MSERAVKFDFFVAADGLFALVVHSLLVQYFRATVGAKSFGTVCR